MYEQSKLGPQGRCYVILAVALAVSGMCSCIGTGGPGERSNAGRQLDDVSIDPTFNYETTKQVLVTVEVATQDGSPRPGVLISVYEETGRKLSSGVTDDFGLYQQPLIVPAEHERLEVVAGLIGSVNHKVITIEPTTKVTFEMTENSS